MALSWVNSCFKDISSPFIFMKFNVRMHTIFYGPVRSYFSKYKKPIIVVFARCLITAPLFELFKLKK